MFSFLQPKAYLNNILPNNYIDIHNHLLPAIDDGAANTNETNSLINGMKELGISNAIATPHTFFGRWDNTAQEIKDAYTIYKKEVTDSSFITKYASEYMLDSQLIEKANIESLLCLKDNYLLVELPLFHCPIDLYELLFELKIKGYKIVIAHPERYTYFHDSLRKFEKLKEFEVEFQMNLLSITGYYSKAILKCTQELFKNDFYNYTGTDIHHVQHIERLKTKPLLCNDHNKFNELLSSNSIFK